MNKIPLAVALAGAALCASQVFAAEQLATGNKRCLPLSQIHQTEVLNNKTILFHMNNGKTYRNTLPYTCPGLGFNKSFAYKTSLSVLCDLDTITVLEQPYTQLGATCGLGKFEPYQPAKDNGAKKASGGSKSSGEKTGQ